MSWSHHRSIVIVINDFLNTSLLIKQYAQAQLTKFKRNELVAAQCKPFAKNQFKQNVNRNGGSSGALIIISYHHPMHSDENNKKKKIIKVYNLNGLNWIIWHTSYTGCYGHWTFISCCRHIHTGHNKQIYALCCNDQTYIYMVFIQTAIV